MCCQPEVIDEEDPVVEYSEYTLIVEEDDPIEIAPAAPVNPTQEMLDEIAERDEEIAEEGAPE